MDAKAAARIYGTPIAGVLVVVAIAVALGDALTMLVASFALAYLAYPAVARLERWGLDRRIGVAATFVLLLGAVALLFAFAVPAVYRDAQAFARTFPTQLGRLLARVEAFAGGYGIEIALERDAAVASVREALGSLSTETLRSAGLAVARGVGNVVGVLVAALNLFLFPVFFYYVLADYERIRGGIKRLVPPYAAGSVDEWLGRADRVLSGFVRGQIVVALVLAVLYSAALAAVGLRFGLAIGVATGLLSIIPYVGFSLGIGVAAIVALAHGGGLAMVAAVGAAFLVVQTLESTVLTPQLVGDKVGLNALETMLALIVGGNLLGLAGMLMAIPAGGLLKQALAALRDAYLSSELYAPASESDGDAQA